MKIDPYNNKERYLEWRRKTEINIPELSPENSDLIKRYLNDMENGLNTSSAKRGARSYLRLNSLRIRITFLAKQFSNKFQLNNVANITEEQLTNFFAEMRNGKITKRNGKAFACVKDYVQDFKALWHWWMKVNRKKGITIPEITSDLDTSGYKPAWVYLTEEDIKKLCENAKYNYKVLIMFLFDTGIRAPTELMNVRVSDLFNNCKELHIREETSKTFGRKIKLLLCSELLKEYIKNQNLSHDSYVFDISPPVVNRYLKRLATRIFADKTSEAGEKYCKLTMYDFRHNSCCYWLPRYKSENALKYRFGWKDSERIHYYSELLGMKDTIQEEDLLMDVTKTEIEKRLMQSEKDNQLLKEDNQAMKEQMSKILDLVGTLGKKFETINIRPEINP